MTYEQIIAALPGLTVEQLLDLKREAQRAGETKLRETGTGDLTLEEYTFATSGRRGDPLSCVKLIRVRLGCSLTEAKTVMDRALGRTASRL